ncbi:MAG: DNA-binding CsgD family transcriptional regulator [Halioglobus sp.]|jgi:DNA-binding CsgD family transcriptional regulator
MVTANKALATAIDAIGTGEFSPALLAYIGSVAHFDSAVIMAYPSGSALRVIHNALHEGDQPGFGSTYRQGLWLLSPLYLSAKAGLRGFFHILDIAPKNFKNSDYYDLYYRSNGVLDHTGFLLETGEGSALAISLERTPKLNAYNKEDKANLSAISEVVAALVKRQWPGDISVMINDSQEIPEPKLHLHVERLLTQFGSSILTARERDVVQLVLKGFSSKAAAQHLGISVQTERVHRKNIYHKLGLSSHNELFSVFFSALARPTPTHGDPLEAILSSG